MTLISEQLKKKPIATLYSGIDDSSPICCYKRDGANTQANIVLYLTYIFISLFSF